jgi:hypothetical protein
MQETISFIKDAFAAHANTTLALRVHKCLVLYACNDNKCVVLIAYLSNIIKV